MTPPQLPLPGFTLVEVVEWDEEEQDWVVDFDLVPPVGDIHD